MFDTIRSFIYEYTLVVPFCALCVAILVRGIVHAMKGRFSFSNMLGSGGMPSAHSTFVIALATAIGIKNGI
jgi:acid phosphatase family membrane protein YuiD